MVGKAFEKIETEHRLVLVGSHQCDLKSWIETKRMVEEQSPDAIIHLAAKVGGVKANTDYIADFCADNLIINTNVLAAANFSNVNRVLSLLSTCQTVCDIVP